MKCQSCMSNAHKAKKKWLAQGDGGYQIIISSDYFICKQCTLDQLEVIYKERDLK